MPTVLVELTARPVDWPRWAATLPGLIERARTVPFGADGVAVPVGVRREGLRLLGGEAGRPGARYRLVTVADPAASTAGELADQLVDQAPGRPDSGIRLDPPVDIEVVTDDSSELSLILDTPEMTVTISIAQPADPESITVQVSGATPDFPAWLGQRIELHGAIELDPTGRARLVARGGLERLRVSADAHFVPARTDLVLQTDLVAEPDRDVLRASVDIRPTGPLAISTLAWPFVRGWVRRELEHVVTEAWAAIERKLSTDRTVDQLVEDVFSDGMNGIAEHVPTDQGSSI